MIYDRRRRSEVGRWPQRDLSNEKVDLAVNSRGRAIAVAGRSKSRIWLSTGGNGVLQDCPVIYPDALVFDHSLPILWAGFQDPLDSSTGLIGCIGALDAATGARLATWQNMESKQALAVSTITSLAVGNRYLVTGSHDATVKIFNFVGRGGLELTATAGSANGYVTDVALSPDETLVLAGTSQGDYDRPASGRSNHLVVPPAWRLDNCCGVQCGRPFGRERCQRSAAGSVAAR